MSSMETVSNSVLRGGFKKGETVILIGSAEENDTRPCISCSTGEMRFETKDLKLKHHTARNLTGWHCDCCQAVIFDDYDSAKEYWAIKEKEKVQ